MAATLPKQFALSRGNQLRAAMGKMIEDATVELEQFEGGIRVKGKSQIFYRGTIGRLEMRSTSLTACTHAAAITWGEPDKGLGVSEFVRGTAELQGGSKFSIIGAEVLNLPLSR